jgi:RsiW-degrading membrane proteinase PrsW (M82 family)
MASNMPPVPRDHDEASFSEIVPIRSGKISLLKSPLFICGIVIAIATVLLFSLGDDLGRARTLQDAMSVFRQMTMVITTCLLMLVLFALLLYSKSDRKIWYFAFPIIVISLLLMVPPLLKFFFFVFRELLPGGANLTKSPIFFNAFIGMFFGAGLMEELMKAVPVLIGAGLSIYAVRVRGNLPTWLFDLLRVRGPVDGLLMGAAAGAGFIFIETLFQYVPGQVISVLKGAQGNITQKDVYAAFGSGLMLLFPRVINGLAGHMAYAGIFGYFIGLAVIRPKRAPMLLLIGWLTASILHALWNSVGTISGGLGLHYLVAAATVVAMIACLLKARQLEATIFGRGVDTSGSIIVGSSGPAYGMAPAPAPAPAPQWGAAPQPAPQWGAPMPAPGGPPVGFPGAHPPPGAPPGFGYPPSRPEAATTPMQPTVPVAGPLALAVGGVNVPLLPGARIDLATIPALGERARGLLGEVSVHPRNPGVIGLKNTGGATWYARLRDGSVQPVEPQRNVRLASGVSIDFGGGIHGAIVG